MFGYVIVLKKGEKLIDILQLEELLVNYAKNEVKFISIDPFDDIGVTLEFLISTSLFQQTFFDKFINDIKFQMTESHLEEQGSS